MDEAANEQTGNKMLPAKLKEDVDLETKGKASSVYIYIYIDKRLRGPGALGTPVAKTFLVQAPWCDGDDGDDESDGPRGDGDDGRKHTLSTQRMVRSLFAARAAPQTPIHT